MAEQSIRQHHFDNGLTLLIESMADVQSAAFALSVPAGSIYDPAGRNATGSVLCDWMTRGAGDLDSRALSTAMDNLGLQRNENVGTAHMSFSCATLAENLADGLRLYADVVRRPHLPEDQFEAARSGVEQSLRALEDEPRQKIFQELRRRCYDAPWGLPTDGTLDDLPALSAESLREHYRRCFRPNGAILGVAGRVDADAMVDVVGRLFGDWQPQDDPPLAEAPRGPQRDHIDHESTQTHIGIAYPAVPYSDPDYYAAWAAVSVLSGGMSSRLFTEVREKRGLCYAVSASMNSLKHEARVLCYAGTTNERAQETLDVTLAELKRLAAGIEPSELDRCKARAKSSLVMQQESTMARAGSVARDWYHLGRVTTLDEVRRKIDALTVDAVLSYVHAHPAENFAILTIGPESLDTPAE